MPKYCSLPYTLYPIPNTPQLKALLAEHLTSGRTEKDWAKASLPEYAFIGRSNVGKSSLINMLCHINKLARVSNTPGRTRNVEHGDRDPRRGEIGGSADDSPCDEAVAPKAHGLQSVGFGGYRFITW